MELVSPTMTTARHAGRVENMAVEFFCCCCRYCCFLFVFWGVGVCLSASARKLGLGLGLVSDVLGWFSGQQKDEEEGKDLNSVDQRVG